ncbi:MAG TPA: hypothetical protein VEK57_29560 [Thermoanaerobaculia bacterium]|nr:hypothetical protein [Thermoanaerobaculia bacterium]
MTTVNFFNANIEALNVTVNRGREFTVAAVNTTTWVPGTIASGGPGWDNGGPSTNNLGPGDNLLQVRLGTSAITSATVTLPAAAVLAVQVYFMFPQVGSASNVSWSALYQGQLIASGTSGMQMTAEGGGGGGAAQVEPE